MQSRKAASRVKPWATGSSGMRSARGAATADPSGDVWQDARRGHPCAARVTVFHAGGRDGCRAVALLRDGRAERIVGALPRKPRKVGAWTPQGRVAFEHRL